MARVSSNKSRAILMFIFDRRVGFRQGSGRQLVCLSGLLVGVENIEITYFLSLYIGVGFLRVEGGFSRPL